MEICKEEIMEAETEDQYIRRRHILLPGCCDESTAALRPFLQLKFEDDAVKDADDGIPEWTIPHLDYYYASEFITPVFIDGLNYGFEKTCIPAKFCPFCGHKLPEVRMKKTPPDPISKFDDHYCLTCDERCMCCNCWPPEAAFEVVK